LDSAQEGVTSDECLVCSTQTAVEIVRSQVLQRKASEIAVREVGRALWEATMELARKHAAVIEGLLQQLVASGRDLSGMVYERYQSGREVLRCEGVRVLLIVQKCSGLDFGTVYYLYWLPMNDERLLAAHNQARPGAETEAFIC